MKWRLAAFVGPFLCFPHTTPWKQQKNLTLDVTLHPTGLQSSWEMGLQTPNPRVAQPGAVVTWRKPLTTSGSPLSILVTGTRSF